MSLPGMGGAGTSRSMKRGAGGWIGSSGYDAGAALQQKLAQEQWDWQKKEYRQQAASGVQAGEGLTTMVDQYNQAYGEAKTANEARYQQMLGITDQTSGQRAADIRSDASGQQSDMMQRLASLGMSNTTVAPTMGAGIEREKQAALDRSADALQGTKLGIMERREDEYPDAGMISSLASMFAQGSGGQGVGGIIKALGSMRQG